MRILGIESSCDETAAAIVEIDSDNNLTLLSNVVATSLDLHAKYGGVVPEIAARSHIESIIPVINKSLQGLSMQDNGGGWDDIDGIAVTYGAGLGGSLLVGVMAARTLAIIKNKPLYAINHVEGHVYANFITKVGSISNSQLAIHNDGQGSALNYKLPEKTPEFPLLGLIVSGGHSQLVLFRDHFDYTLLGQTQDDAVGEAFDKVAKIIGLPYPGGPSVGKKAQEGDPYAFDLPKAKMAHKYDFSFSGLKTAVLRRAQDMIGEDFTFPSKDLPERLSDAQKANIAAVFQRVAIETVVDKTIQAYEEFSPASVVIAGGVAASPELRRQLKERLGEVLGRSQDLRLDAQQGAAEESQQAVQSGTVSEHRRTATQLGAKNSGGVVGSADKSAIVTQILRYQDPKLCTDNGAMIAALGAFKMKLGQPAADPYSLEIQPNLSM